MVKLNTKNFHLLYPYLKKRKNKIKSTSYINSYVYFTCFSASSSKSPIEIFNHLSNPDTLKSIEIHSIVPSHGNIARSLDIYLSIYRYLHESTIAAGKNLTLLTFEYTRSDEISVNNDMNRPDSHFHPSSSMSLLPRGPLTRNGLLQCSVQRRTTTRHPRNPDDCLKTSLSVECMAGELSHTEFAHRHLTAFMVALRCRGTIRRRATLSYDL